MRKIKLRFGAVWLAACLGLVMSFAAGGANAQDEQARFKLYFGGIPAGELVFNARNNGTTYQVAGKVRSTGLIGALVKVSYTAQTAGRVINGKLQTSSYKEQANTGRRQQSSSLSYKNGVPQVLQVEPPRKPGKWDVNPATQKGSLDPLSMIYSLLREVDQANACRMNQKMFDGRRVTEIVLGKPTTKDGNIVCGGVYRRLDGFSDKDMQERTEFKFTATYGPSGNGRFQIDRLSAESLYGRAIIKRR